MKRFMVDLETLGLNPHSVVLSAGIVEFDEQTILSRLHVKFAVDQQIDAGRVINGSTIDWWMMQDEKARVALFSGSAVQNRLIVEDGLDLIFRFMHGADEVWGNGAAFDNVVLRDLFMHMKGISPWGYKADRCYRTIKAMNKHLPQPTFMGVEHNALDDAVNQTVHLQHMLWGQYADAERTKESPKT